MSSRFERQLRVELDGPTADVEESKIRRSEDPKKTSSVVSLNRADL